MMKLITMYHWWLVSEVGTNLTTSCEGYLSYPERHVACHTFLSTDTLRAIWGGG